VSETTPAHMTVSPMFERLEPRLLLSAGSTDLPAPAIPDLLAAYDTGLSNSDNVTSRDNSTTSKVLAFEVEDVVPGATVRVYCDGALIGQADAAGDAVVVETDGVTTLSAGSHEITAVQSLADADGVDESPASAALDVQIADGGLRIVVLNGSGDIIGATSFGSFGDMGLNTSYNDCDFSSQGVRFTLATVDSESAVDSADAVVWTVSCAGDSSKSDADTSADAPGAESRYLAPPDGASTVVSPHQAGANANGASDEAARGANALSAAAPSRVFQLTLPAWSDRGAQRQVGFVHGRAMHLSGGTSGRELGLADAVASIASAIPAMPTDGGPAQAAPALSAGSSDAPRVAQGVADPAEGDGRRRRESGRTTVESESAMRLVGDARLPRRGDGATYVQDAVVLAILLHGLRQPPVTSDQLIRPARLTDPARWMAASVYGSGSDAIAVARPVSAPLYPGPAGSRAPDV